MLCILPLCRAAEGEEEAEEEEGYSYFYQSVFSVQNTNQKGEKFKYTKDFSPFPLFSFSPLLFFSALFFTSYILHLLYTTSCVAAPQRPV
jgi:hypothetical protein